MSTRRAASDRLRQVGRYAPDEPVLVRRSAFADRPGGPPKLHAKAEDAAYVNSSEPEVGVERSARDAVRTLEGRKLGFERFDPRKEIGRAHAERGANRRNDLCGGARAAAVVVDFEDPEHPVARQHVDRAFLFVDLDDAAGDSADVDRR